MKWLKNASGAYKARQLNQYPEVHPEGQRPSGRPRMTYQSHTLIWDRTVGRVYRKRMQCAWTGMDGDNIQILLQPNSERKKEEEEEEEKKKKFLSETFKYHIHILCTIIKRLPHKNKNINCLVLN